MGMSTKGWSRKWTGRKGTGGQPTIAPPRGKLERTSSTSRPTSARKEKKSRQYIATIRCSTLPYDSRARIKIKMEDKIVLAVVDTVAARSILNSNVYNSLKNKGELRTSEDVELFDISDNQLKTGGQVKLSFKFGEIDILEQDFVILKGMKPSCLLGMDAIENHQFIIDGKLRPVYRVILEGDTTEEELLLANPYQIPIPPYKMVNCLLATSESKENEKLNSGKAQVCKNRDERHPYRDG